MKEWFYDVRDRMFNAMASWLMKHCRCATYTFWVCCSRFSNAEVRAYADEWLKWRS
ncbi:MAG: hypothetical protein II453_20160 [Alphaproteobacteria bacterium]|nr:hypothetical protein [Alphaproteobacteria bacterium]